VTARPRWAAEPPLPSCGVAYRRWRRARVSSAASTRRRLAQARGAVARASALAPTRRPSVVARRRQVPALDESGGPATRSRGLSRSAAEAGLSMARAQDAPSGRRVNVWPSARQTPPRDDEQACRSSLLLLHMCGRRACRSSRGPCGDAGNIPCRRQGDRVVAPWSKGAAAYWLRTTMVTSGSMDARAPAPMLSSGTTTAGGAARRRGGRPHVQTTLSGWTYRSRRRRRSIREASRRRRDAGDQARDTPCTTWTSYERN
jgi:hypothetical protein